MSTPTVLDVLDVTDLRFAGGTAASLVEEVRAQAAAGWRTGLAHLPGPLVARAVPVHPGLRALVEAGSARLVLDEPVEAGVLVLRHPAVVQHALAALPPVRTEHVVMVANAVPVDVDGHRHYDPRVVHRMLTERWGAAPRWAPISPAVRAAVAPDLPAGALLEDDWVNVLDLDRWEVPRARPAGERPVIGRHSRPAPAKWPTDVETLRTVYPTDGSMEVRVLGGAEPARRLLGTLPSSWTVLPFGAVPAQEFLAGLDVFVYFHDPTMVEGFGRTVLEAIAAGVPAVVPTAFREVFGDSVLAVEPHEVRATVLALHADSAAYDEQVRRARATARRRFGHEAHVARLRPLLGLPPAGEPVTAVPSPTADAAGARDPLPTAGPAPGSPPTGVRAAAPRTGTGPVLVRAAAGTRARATRVVRRQVLPWLRGRPVVERVARQVLLTEDVPPPARSAAVGSLLVGLGAGSLPVVLVLGRGLDDDALAALERQVAEVQLLGAAFRPVLVTDAGRAAPGRYGYDQEQLAADHPGTGPTSLRAQLAELVTAYGARTVVVAGHDGLDDAATAVLGTLGPA